jgi:hypothetical protein
MIRLADARPLNRDSFRHSSRSRPLNDSIKAFCICLPGDVTRDYEQLPAVQLPAVAETLILIAASATLLRRWP